MAKSYDLPAYKLVLQEEIPDIQSSGYVFRHKKSGARVMVLSNEDENKVFHITFRTPPANSTGVPHILEHSVLCGSRKFPSKDPFVELVKGSLNTFLNAMTYPDKTMYPIASCNDKDFKDLMHVYMDAVFYTNIYEKEEIFCQEGWSYHLEDPEDELTYNGVVYNEMKGAFSSPDDVLDREILNALYPDTPYGNESGGDPAFIPDLSYEEFLEFHRHYYHPSNSYIYLYGNMDVEERLNWLDKEYLSAYEKAPVDSVIRPQTAFKEPAEVYKKYSILNTDSVEDNTYLSFNVSVGTSLDVELSNAFAVIEYALLSAPGAPLKQALLDAKVGKDIIGSYESGIYQPMFSVVAKSSNTSQKDNFLRIIREVVGEIADKGMDEKALLAGINNMEFRFREADYGAYPKGLMYGIDIMDSWLYDDAHPFDYVKELKVFDFLKKQVGTGYYENLLRKYILDNPHAAVVVVEPEKGLTAKIDEETKQKLAKYKAGLTKEEIDSLVEKTERLRLFQETPSTEEELEAIPMLQKEDIKKQVEPLINEEYTFGGIKTLYHRTPTNGVAYLSLLFNADSVPKEYVPYLGILRAVLTMVDTEHYTYGELFNEINIHTGGIFPSLTAYPDVERENAYKAMFEIKAKTLYEKLDFTFGMIEEILFTSKLEDEKRLYEIIAELKSRYSTRLNSSGHVTAAVRAMSYFSNIAVFNDSVSGIAFYKLTEDLEAHFEEKKGELIRILKELVRILFRQENLLVSYTSDPEGFEGMDRRIETLKEKLGSQKLETVDNRLAPGGHNEGFQTSSKIQYVARAGNFRKAGYEYTGALRILKLILSYEYLWVNIRVKGGAYGCMSGFGKAGDSYFVSYRDPNLKKTDEVYMGIPDYVRNFEVSGRDMLKYIIGTVSELDTPLTPSARGQRSLSAYLNRITAEELQQERDEILNADQESIRKLAPIIEAIIAENCICVIGNEEKLSEEKDMFEELKPFVG